MRATTDVDVAAADIAAYVSVRERCHRHRRHRHCHGCQ
jgi:hypothetical protein